MNRRGKVFALSTAALGLTVLALTTWSARDRIREEWLLWRLGSTDAGTRLYAAMELGRLKCVRAIPEIIRAILIAEGERVHQVNLMTVELTPLVYCIYQIGQPALPHLTAVTESKPFFDALADAIRSPNIQVTSVPAAEELPIMGSSRLR